jgi:hypothetical protein
MIINLEMLLLQVASKQLDHVGAMPLVRPFQWSDAFEVVGMKQGSAFLNQYFDDGNVALFCGER